METKTKAVKTVGDLAPGYSIRKFKSFRGMEGLGFDLDLHREGRRAATVLDEGNGGMFRFDFASPDEEGRFTALAKAHRDADPEAETDPEGGLDKPWADSSACDGFMAALVDAHETERKFRRDCRTKTLVQVGDKIGSDEFLVFRRPFSPEVKALIAGKYPGQRVAFVNEELSG